MFVSLNALNAIQLQYKHNSSATDCMTTGVKLLLHYFSFANKSINTSHKPYSLLKTDGLSLK